MEVCPPTLPSANNAGIHELLPWLFSIEDSQLQFFLIANLFIRVNIIIDFQNSFQHSGLYINQ